MRLIQKIVLLLKKSSDVDEALPVGPPSGDAYLDEDGTSYYRNEDGSFILEE